MILEYFRFYIRQGWLGTYERPSNPSRNSFYIVSEANYGRFSVSFLTKRGALKMRIFGTLVIWGWSKPYLELSDFPEN